jgi:hypothetical protein
MAGPLDQQAQFDSAFAQAAVKPAKFVDSETPLPFVPAQRYVEKNLAPEQTLNHGDVAALAMARRHAEENGVLSPELGEYMLPMAMVEGRGSIPSKLKTFTSQLAGSMSWPSKPQPGNFGINEDNMFHPKPSTIDRFKKMGLYVTDLTDPADVAARRYDSHEYNSDTGRWSYYRHENEVVPSSAVTGVVGGKFAGPEAASEPVVMRKVPFDPPPINDMVIQYLHSRDKNGVPLPPRRVLSPGAAGTSETYARMMAAILAEKHSVNPDPANLEKSVSLYNGQGGSYRVPGASAEQYLEKVKAAKELLAHPRNAALMAHYNSVYLKKR